MENRNGFAIYGRASQATGTAETESALAMGNEVLGKHDITVGGDKRVDSADFMSGLMAPKLTPHVARNTTSRRSENVKKISSITLMSLLPRPCKLS